MEKKAAKRVDGSGQKGEGMEGMGEEANERTARKIEKRDAEGRVTYSQKFSLSQDLLAGACTTRRCSLAITSSR